MPLSPDRAKLELDVQRRLRSPYGIIFGGTHTKSARVHFQQGTNESRSHRRRRSDRYSPESARGSKTALLFIFVLFVVRGVLLVVRAAASFQATPLVTARLKVEQQHCRPRQIPHQTPLKQRVPALHRLQPDRHRKVTRHVLTEEQQRRQHRRRQHRRLQRRRRKRPKQTRGQRTV